MLFKRFFKSILPQVLNALPGLLVAVIACLLTNHGAWADTPDTAGPAAYYGSDAQSMGDVICNIATNSKAFSTIGQMVAYILGVACVIRGVHHFRGHTESPQNFPLRNGIMLWVGGAMLLVLPAVIGTIVESLYGSGGGSAGATSCNGTGNYAGGGGQTLDVMLSAFVGNISTPMRILVSVIAIVCGIIMIIRGLTKAAQHGIDARTHSVNAILANVIFGGILVSIGTNFNLMMSSMFGTTTVTTKDSVTSWTFVQTLGGSQQFITAVQAGLTFIQIIGAIAFVRGWMILKKVVEGGGQATMAQGITHLLGGVAAINIFGFLKIMDATLGTGLM